MRWLWGLSVLPFLMGAMCLGGVVVAFVAGRWSANPGSEPGAESSEQPTDVNTHG